MSGTPRRDLVRFGVFELDRVSGELSKQGVRLRLREKPLQILLALLDRPGGTVTRQELQARLWPDGTSVEFENGINNAISRLRDALGDAAESPRFIETLPRRGYRFIAPVELVVDPSDVVPPGEPSASEEAAAAAAVSRATSRSRSRLGAGMAAAAILLTVVGFVWTRPSPEGAATLAVLPFLSGGAAEESDDAYLAFGMTDALIGELSRFGALRVISQTSVMRYKDERKTLPEIARELGVGAVVEGSVVREGGLVRITVQLVDARTDSHLWTQTYTRDPSAALSGQRELAREVAGLIRSRLVPSDRSAVPLPQETNAAAYEAYVKGRYFMQQPDEGSMARAREFFERSIAEDPDFAPSHVGLANYFVLTDAVPPAEAMPLARASARRALALDEGSAAAHAALAFVHYFGDWDWGAADRAFARAIELDPNDALSRRWHALFLSSMGRHATAIEEVRRAIDLDPVSISAFDAAAAVMSNARRFEAVLEHAARIRDLDASDPRGAMHFAVGYLHSGRFAEAVEAARQGADLSAQNPAFLCVLSVALHRAGRTTEAREVLSEIEELAATGFVPDAFLAVAYLWLGDPDKAMRQLERAYEHRDSYLVVANVAPWLDPLRGDSRFQDLLRRMQFPP